MTQIASANKVIRLTKSSNVDLTNKNELLSYLKAKRLWAKKSLSQNFLVDKNALDKIVDAADLKEDDFVVEVGPGLGVLTQELVKKAGEVAAVEKDEKLAALLEQQFTNLKNEKSLKIVNCKLKIICDDIMKVNLDQVLYHHKYKVVANIPYAITSKIIELFLSRENKPELIVLLVQKEVAERICAKAGDMSILAISVQLFGEPEIVDVVPAGSFFPSPKVDSAILRIRIKNQESRIQDKEEEKAFFRLIHVGFASRRKTLLNNLSAGYPLSKEKVSGILESIGLNANTRAQELSIDKWRELLDKISH